MIVTFLSWVYIFMITVVIGFMVNKVLSRFISVPSFNNIGITGMVVTGLVALTVYAEYFSIFYKIGAAAHFGMLLFWAFGIYWCHTELSVLVNELKNKLMGKKAIVYIIVVLIAAFYSSRGQYHTDTGIYHAQAIRIIEEYGCIKGLGNFQLHFAYNSSYLVLCALFTMSFVLPAALHSMTGFFMVLFTCYAFDGMSRSVDHRRHAGDLAKFGILVYAFTNLTGLQSPATDYGTMFFALYILSTWISYAEEKMDRTNDIAMYGYLSVLAIFAVSMKLSAAGLVIIAIWPFILLLRGKRYKEIVFFIIIGFLSFLPYMIRNVIISGWLFYPVASIDLFNVIWKIPVEYLEQDAAQIKVWGRCLYDVSRLNDSFSVWIPEWWHGQQSYGKMLIYAQIPGGICALIHLGRMLVRKKIRIDVLVFYLSIYVNIALWFFTAPFIRYGLAFLLLLPLCAAGDLIEDFAKTDRIRFNIVTIVIFFWLLGWYLNYFDDNVEFISNYGNDGYVLWPIPFEDAETDVVDMDGVTVYNSTKEEVNSYYYCPNSCYHDMIDRTKLIGSTIEEGFMPREVED